MELEFPNKQQQLFLRSLAFFLRRDICDNDFQKNKDIFPFVHFTNMNSSPTEVAHIQIPNVRENVKMENKTLQIINPKKGKYFFFFSTEASGYHQVLADSANHGARGRKRGRRSKDAQISRSAC